MVVRNSHWHVAEHRKNCRLRRLNCLSHALAWRVFKIPAVLRSARKSAGPSDTGAFSFGSFSLGKQRKWTIIVLAMKRNSPSIYSSTVIRDEPNFMGTQPEGKYKIKLALKISFFVQESNLHGPCCTSESPLWWSAKACFSSILFPLYKSASLELFIVSQTLRRKICDNLPHPSSLSFHIE